MQFVRKTLIFFQSTLNIIAERFLASFEKCEASSNAHVYLCYILDSMIFLSILSPFCFNCVEIHKK